jgi:hypothetical protein
VKLRSSGTNCTEPRYPKDSGKDFGDVIHYDIVRDTIDTVSCTIDTVFLYGEYRTLRIKIKSSLFRPSD